MSTVSGSWSVYLNARVGPFEDSVGDLFVVVNGASDVEVHRSQDDGSSWSLFASFGTAPGGIDAVQDGDTLHVANIPDGANFFVTVYEVSLSNGSVSSTATSPDVTVRNISGKRPGHLARRSDGSYVVLHQTDPEMIMGTDYRRVGVLVWDGSSWSLTIPSYQDGVEFNFDARAAILGTNDRVHHFVTEGTGGARVATFLTDGTVTFDTHSAGISGNNYSHGLPHRDGGTVAFVYSGAGPTVAVRRFTSSDSVTVSDFETVSSQAPQREQANIGALVYDGDGVLHAFYVRGDNGNIEHVNDQGTGTWTTPEAFATATAQGISARLIAGAIGVLYDDNGTVTFDALSLASGPPVELGSASGSGVGTGTATGIEAVVVASASGSGAGSGSAAATSVVVASAHGSGVGSGSASAVAIAPAVTASASGSGVGTGSASAVSLVTASASGSGVGTGSATAQVTEFASASGSGVGTGTAAAIEITPAVTASAHGSGVGTGTAAGEVVGFVFGTAAGSGVGTGTATATAIVFASASGSGVGSGIAAAIEVTQEVLASASGSGVGTGSASGLVVVFASASGSGAGSGTATALALVTASAHGSGVGTGSATGAAFALASAHGSGVGTGTAAALEVLDIVLASAAGSGVGTGAASGLVVEFASAAGSGIGTSSATAFAFVVASAHGSGIGTGSASGFILLFGVAHGSGVGTGSATGFVALVVGVAQGSGVGFGAATARLLLFVESIPPARHVVIAPEARLVQVFAESRTVWALPGEHATQIAEDRTVLVEPEDLDPQVEDEQRTALVSH